MKHECNQCGEEIDGLAFGLRSMTMIDATDRYMFLTNPQETLRFCSGKCLGHWADDIAPTVDTEDMVPNNKV
jgi:hypothetical protein